MNMTNHKIMISALLAAAWLPASAQYNQSISVEGKYVPEVFRLDRINTFPKAVKFSLESRPLSYDSKSVPAAFAPRLLPLPATGWRADRFFSDKRGYLELGAGSWLNTTLSAGYRFMQTPQTTVGVRLQHNSTSLWKPKLSPLTADNRMERYDETLGVYGKHDFAGKGTLSGAVDWHIGNFNYYGYNPTWYAALPDEKMAAPTQTLNDVSARFTWESPSRHDDISWMAGAGVRYFGYRSAYGAYIPYIGNPSVLDDPMLGRYHGGRETDISLNAGIIFPSSSGSAFGVDLDADIMLYAGETPDGGFPVNVPDDYGVVKLTPYYSFTRNRLKVRVGAEIDFAFNAGDQDDRYNFLHVAPDVKVDWTSGPVSLYVHLLGGSRLNTLAGNWQHDYYQQPWLNSSRPVYSPLDGSLGATFGPFAGFSAGLDFAFRVTRGEYLGGWYMARMNYADEVFPGLPEEIDGNPVSYSYAPVSGVNMHGFSLGAHLGYDMGRVLSLKARGTYQPQNGSKGYFNGYDRPRLTALVSAETNPWRELRLKLEYEYRGVRTAYTQGRYADNVMADSRVLAGYRLPDLCYLNFGASYGITDNFTLWLQADNLLNRHDAILPGLPQQGVRVAGGFGVTF